MKKIEQNTWAIARVCGGAYNFHKGNCCSTSRSPSKYFFGYWFFGFRLTRKA